MRCTLLNTNEIYNFKVLPNPLLVGPQPLTAPDHYDSHFHPQVGLLEYNNVSFPHMHVMDLKWKTNESVTMVNENPINTINFNFQLTGYQEMKYMSLDYNLDTKKGEHYFVFNPDNAYQHTARADSYLEILHISMDKEFFASSICGDDKWTQDMLRNIYLNRSFSGLNQALEITPPMWQLIREIRDNKSKGPLRNLMVQSKALELIALQLDQLRKPSLPEEIHEDDAEKLYHLKTYLDANFLCDLSLAQLSRQCLLNEFKVKRGFKLLFGSSVFNYLKKIRMHYAINLLQDQGLTVDQVANILGYEHAQHFSTAFKTFVGVSPSQYQAKKFTGA